MISVIIPLMPIRPYDIQAERCAIALQQQEGVDIEILVQKQPIEKYINKNKLLNEGFEKSSGEYVWHCDADYLPGDNELLFRMATILEDKKLDLIWPMYWSAYKYWKIADGGPFMKRSVLEKHGPLDESLLGAAGVTMPFVKWCIDNVKYFAHPSMWVRLQTPTYTGNKIHRETSAKNHLLRDQVFAQLKKEGIHAIGKRKTY